MSFRCTLVAEMRLPYPFIKKYLRIELFFYLCAVFEKTSAQMAELVDALVSNTNECKFVPVRSRLRALPV